MALLALTVACGSGDGDKPAAHGSRVPSAEEIVGTYDLTVVAPGGGRLAVGVGAVAVGADVYVELSYPSVALHGLLHRNGRVVLEGVHTNADVLGPASATGMALARDGMYRIALTVRDGTRVVLERPFGSDLRTAAGRFQLDVSSPAGCRCTGPIAIEAAIDRTGSATLTTPPDGGDRTRARFGYATVDVAPSGRFHLDADYVPPEGSEPVGISGPPFVMVIDGTWPAAPVGSTSLARYVLLSGLRMQIESGDVTLTRLE